MAQYRQGTVSVTSGSPWVSGAGTLFSSTSGIVPGVLFNLEGDSGWYYVASVPSNSALSLTTNYTGTTQTNQPYVIVRDYLTPQSIPLMHKGDINWTSIFNEAMLRVKASLDSVTSGGSASGSGTGLDGAYDIESTVAVDTAPVIFNRTGYYGSSQNANAFRIVDQNTSGPATMPPVEGALQYIYSKHRVPLIAVSNIADRAQPASPSSTAHAAIVGLAMADEHAQFESFTPTTNIGIAAYARDYHGSYGVSASSNVGILAHSQRGYGLVAQSDSSYAVFVQQATSLDGIYSSARRPLTVSNQAFGDASNSFAITVQARRAGIDVQSTEAGVAGAPLLKLTSTGRAFESAGEAVLYNTATALEVSGGSVSAPVTNINAPNGVGLQVYSGTTHGISASSSGPPSIKAVNGIITYAADKDNITNPEAGALVYSDADSDLMFHNGVEWLSATASGGVGGGGIPTMQQVYEAGNSISVPVGAGGAGALLINSTDDVAFRVQNANTFEPKNSIEVYTARGWGIVLSGAAADSNYGGMNISAGDGTCIKGYSLGPFASYSTPGIAAGYGMSLDCGTGGGISVTTANEATPALGSLKLQTGSGTGISMQTTSGKLIDYTASAGALEGDRYAITASCGTGGGMHIYATGTQRANLRLENTNTLSTLLEIEAGGGTGISITNAERGITASSQGDYAILGKSNQHPSIKSYNGIVAYSVSTDAIPNPESGTITFSWFDKMMYYYVDDINGWMPIAIPSGYVAPTGAPSCLCIDGVIIYTSDINLISSGAMAEGQLVFDSATQTVYVADQTLTWQGIAGGGASGCICPNGVVIYHWDKEDIATPAEGTLIYEGENQAVYYFDGVSWIEVGGGGGGSYGTGVYTRGYNLFWVGDAALENDAASFIVPYDGVITAIKVAVDVAPGTGGMSFDVRKKESEGTLGSSILGGTPITILANNYESSVRVLSENVSQYDTITFDITGIGAGVAGGDDIRFLVYIESDFSGAKGVSLLVTGDITAAMSNAASFIVPYDGILTTVKAAVDEAPTDGDFIMSINKKLSGGSTWVEILSPLTISATEYETTTVTINEAVEQGDHINIDIDAIGFTNAGGNDLRVLFSITETGATSYAVVNVSADYTAGPYDRFISVNSASGDITITLPSPGVVGGIPFTIKKDSNDTNTITISGTNIDGQSSVAMVAPWQSLTLMSNGTRYNRV